MNIKIENATYINEHGTVDNSRDGLLTFNADITDLDKELFEGTIPYTFVDYKGEIEDNDSSKIRKYIKSKLNEIKIKNFEDKQSYFITLYRYKTIYNKDIDDDCDAFIKTYDSVYFNNDIFDYTLDSQNVISTIINNYDHLIKDEKIKKEEVSHDFISVSNNIHKLNYSQLIELLNLMVTRYSEVKLHARKLKDKINSSESIDEIKKITWDLWVF